MKQMKPKSKAGRYALAIVACCLIFMAYVAISVAADWKKGGGYLVMLIVFGLISSAWTAITKPNRKQPHNNKENERQSSDTEKQEKE